MRLKSTRTYLALVGKEKVWLPFFQSTHGTKTMMCGLFSTKQYPARMGRTPLAVVRTANPGYISEKSGNAAVSREPSCRSVTTENTEMREVRRCHVHNWFARYTT